MREEAPPPRPAGSLTGYWGSPRLRRVGITVATILGLFLLYEIATSFVAYTDDAYVQSDLVAIAPEVTGRIVAVHVIDNQAVKAGDRLVTIDPVPYQLAVKRSEAEIAEARAQLKAAEDELGGAQEALASATSAYTYATETQRRLKVLAQSDNAPRAELDKAEDELRRSDAEMKVARTVIARAQSSISARKAAIDRATAEWGLAQRNLDLTELKAPVAGPIVNLTVRVGDTATAFVPLIGIIDQRAWRIVANYKQDYIRFLAVGDTAWVWLDSHPWHLHRARIEGIARGVSREKGPEKLMPYVAPTTDWIRLQRRIPVTLTLVDPPADLKLYMGADARSLIFP